MYIYTHMHMNMHIYIMEITDLDVRGPEGEVVAQQLHDQRRVLVALLLQGFGFRVSGLGFRVSGLGFRVQGLGFRVQGPECRVYRGTSLITNTHLPRTSIGP